MSPRPCQWVETESFMVACCVSIENKGTKAYHALIYYVISLTERSNNILYKILYILRDLLRTKQQHIINYIIDII